MVVSSLLMKWSTERLPTVVPTLLILTLAVLLQEEWSLKEQELKRELEEARSVLQSSGGRHGNNEEGSRAVEKVRSEIAHSGIFPISL
jgi:hypothetical protein